MKKLKYSRPFNSRDYFSENLLPAEIFAGRKTIRQQLPFTQHDELELLLIRGGQGTLTVNSTEFPVSQGSFFCFSPHHFHRLIPQKGHTIELSECHVNSGVYFYISACPYFRAIGKVPLYPPLYAQLSPSDARRVESLIDEIAREHQKKTLDTMETQRCFFLLLRLFGILEKFSQIPESSVFSLDLPV